MITVRFIEQWESRFVVSIGVVGALIVLAISSIAGIVGHSVIMAVNTSIYVSLVVGPVVALLCGIVVPLPYMPSRGATYVTMIGFAFRTVVGLAGHPHGWGPVILDFLVTLFGTLLIGAIVGFIGILLSFIFWPVVSLLFGIFGVSKGIVNGIQEQRRLRSGNYRHN